MLSRITSVADAKQLAFGAKGLCVIGCTPYIDLTNDENGILKYRELVREMAENCDVLVHVGDTKPGSMPCDEDKMTKAVHILKEAGSLENKLVLYAPGDNKLNDCHRHGWREDPIESDFYKAADAREFLVQDLGLESSYTDLTGVFFCGSRHGKSGNSRYRSALQL